MFDKKKNITKNEHILRKKKRKTKILQKYWNHSEDGKGKKGKQGDIMTVIRQDFKNSHKIVIATFQKK